MKAKFRISSKSYEVRGTTTYVGRVRYYDSGHYLFSESTGIHRLTPKDAHKDAYGLVYDRENKEIEKIFA